MISEMKHKFLILFLIISPFILFINYQYLNGSIVPGYIISLIATSKLDIKSSIATTKLEYNAKIFCIIMTAANNFELKARLIYDSWAS